MYSLLMARMECPENPCDDVVEFQNPTETIDEYFFLNSKMRKSKTKGIEEIKSVR